MTQKVAYVTGGMGGIGTTMCQRLLKDGFKVIAGCGPSRDFQKWIDEQAALGFKFYASVGNVGDWDSSVAASQSARLILRNMPSRVMPALLTSTSTGPCSALTFWNALTVDSQSPTLPIEA